MKERLDAFLRAEHLTPASFAEKMGIQRSGVSHLLSGRSKPGFEFFEKFLKNYPTINIEWLISGRGKMYKELSMPPLFPDKAFVTKEATPDETVTESYAEQEPEELPAPPSFHEKDSQHVEKVMILYADGTFSDYVRR
ncbi:MAG: helix-turn-helix domain-containing protein [Prevotellaceae bacterium]|jgi:transcriptional regulator with XRE-family HTH domain|nr:helix-turn-helix domain-containing protein [Prevotellaceae bacterium]